MLYNIVALILVMYWKIVGGVLRYSL